MADPAPAPFGISGMDCRYLSLVRDLGAATETTCLPNCNPTMHREDAAKHINAILGNPELLWKLMAVAAGFEKQPPPRLDELKQSFWSLRARLDWESDGSGEKTSSDS